MFNWILHKYILLKLNLIIFVENPTGSEVVSTLKLATSILLVGYFVRVIVHGVVFRNLKLRHAKLSSRMYPEFVKMVYRLCIEMRLPKIPELFLFANKKPLVFTIGTIKPAIFISPKLLNALTTDELKAVVTHELTHIKRYDNLFVRSIQIAKALIPAAIIPVFGREIIFETQTALFWYLLSFVLFLAYRLIIQESAVFRREISCDDLTLGIIKDPLILASSLLKVWKVSHELPQYRWSLDLASVRPFASPNTGFSGRVRRLINYRRSVFKSFSNKFFKAVVISAVMLFSFFIWEYNSSNITTEVQLEEGMVKVGVSSLRASRSEATEDQQQYLIEKQVVTDNEVSQDNKRLRVKVKNMK